MINPFTLRKYIVLLLMPLITVICFFVGLKYYGFLWSLVWLACGLMMSVLLGNLFLKNPFTAMLEGKGLLALNMDSTGIINPFIVGLSSPYIKGKLRGRPIEDVFDRESIYQISEPKRAKNPLEMLNIEGQKIIKIELSEKEYNNKRFAMYQYPVLIYNEQLHSILTKDFFSEIEKSAFAEHSVLYLNRKIEELTSVVRDFGRYVVELTKPGSKLGSKWIWIIIGVVLVILAAMFAPSIINAIKGASGSAGGAIQQATNTIQKPI